MHHLEGLIRTEQIIKLANEMGMVRPQDLQVRGIPRNYLQRLYERGILLRSGRGIYVLADADITENYSLAEACKRVAKGTVCLLSALRYHEIGTQNPSEVWMAVGLHSHRPHMEFPPLKIVHFSGATLTEGIVEQPTAQGVIRVYNVPKTVADCFRFRNKVGLDVAMEALRETWRARRATMDELWHYAKMGRVSTVMKPYLEALV